VVRVDQVLEKPAAIALGPGDSVTVQTVRPGSLKPGTQATFYTTGWIFGRGVAVREVGHEPGRSPVVVADQQEAVARARRDVNDAELRAHIEKAAMVVAGRVEQVRPAELAAAPARPKRITEHDADWQEAIIQVEDGLKGARAGRKSLCGFRAHTTSPGSARPGSPSDRKARSCSTRTPPPAPQPRCSPAGRCPRTRRCTRWTCSPSRMRRTSGT